MLVLNNGFQGKIVPRDEGGEADGQEGEEGQANGGRGGVVEQVVGGLAHVVRHRRRRGQARYQGVGHHLISGEVDDGRRLPPGDEVPGGAEPVRVAHQLRRGVQERDDRHAQAVVVFRVGAEVLGAAAAVHVGGHDDEGQQEIGRAHV